MNTAIKSLRKVLIFNVLVCFLFLAFGSAVHAAVVQMDRQEVIQRSNVIFVGSILEKNARWNEKGNLIVTDYVFEVDDVLLGEVGTNQLTLTFAGGQLEGEGQSVSDVPEFEVGDLALLMLEESAYPLFSPVTGSYQGKFVARNMADSNEQVVYSTGLGNLVAFDGENQPVKNEGGDVIAFEDFVEMVRHEIPVAKSKALPDRSVAQELESIVEKELPSKVYDPSSVTSSMSSSSETVEAVLPASGDQNDDILPEKDAEVVVGDDALFVVSSKNETHEYYSYNHTASGRITWNQLRNYNHDQYMMSYWNKYGDIYRVRSDGGTGTWAWGNGRYDMAGWPDNAAMIRQFGSGWGAGVLGVTYSRWNIFGTRIEADIALNPAYSWTLDDCYTYNHSTVYNIHRTFLHELGHGWGLAHQWYYLSIMNYAPKKFRAYTRLQADDTEAVREAYAYPVSRTDYGVNGHYANGYQNYTDSIVTPTTVTAGSIVNVDHFIIDNTGTYTVYPKVEFYLVPNICSWSGNRYIGTVNFSAVGVFSYGDASNIKLTIPADTPAGNYYLGAYIRSDSVGDNNSTWIDRRITVSRPALAADVTSLWAVSTKKQGETAPLWALVKNTGGATLPASARVYYQVAGPGGLNTYVGYVSAGGLAPGASKWYLYNWAIPANRTPGTHSYYAQVWNSAGGGWLGARKGPQSFTVVAGLSADVTSLWAVGTKKQGETAPLWALVKNTGGATLPASARVYYQVTGPGGLNTYVGYVSAGGLAPDASRWYLFNWAIPANRTPGTHSYYAQVWNSAGGGWLGARKGPQSFTVVAGLSADVTSLWPPGTTGCHGTANLWALVKNTGGAALPASARVYYYVSGPSFGNYVGSVSVGGLAPGYDKWFLVQWKVPYRGEQGTETYNYWARVWDTATSTWLGDWKGPQSFVNLCLE